MRVFKRLDQSTPATVFVVIAVSFLLSLPAVVQAGFRLERVDGSGPPKGIGIRRVVAEPTRYVPPAPIPARHRVQDRTNYPEPTYHVSVRSDVQTKGCEADHAQDRSASGKYWGWYQYDYPSWIDDGGSPSSYGNASTAEQDRVAANAPFDRWPNC